jgi:2-hydroxychromene-2-carboxylate isomerase
MPRVAEFFFDFGSPATYLAWTQLPAMSQASSATIVYRPMLLGGVFQATGNTSPAAVPAKGRYVFKDFLRFAGRYGVPLNINPNFPINTLVLMRIATGLQMRQPKRLEAYMECVFRAIWVDSLNMNDPAVTAQVLIGGGFTPDEMLALASDPEVKAALKATTEEAVERGVFGAPTFFVDDQMFFGQDRLDFVREALIKT